jgi:single-strand DNA-binding protein
MNSIPSRSNSWTEIRIRNPEGAGFSALKGESMSSNNVNQMTLIGALGRDPEVKIFGSGKKAAFFSVATDKEYKDGQGNQKKKTTWHRAVMWGDRGENCAKYLTSGSRVYLQGELRTRDYVNKAGEKRFSTEIHVNELRFLGTSRLGMRENLAPVMEAPALSQ